MDFVIGVKGKDFVAVAADAGVARSIMRLKGKEDKIIHIDSHKLMGCAGPAADRANFCEYIQRNVAYYEYKNGMKLDTAATANYTRKQLAEALRKGPYETNLVIAGYDEKVGPRLFHMDYLASMHEVNMSAHGYGAYFTFSVLDRHWREGMSEKDVLSLLKKCINELETRFIIAMPEFVVKIVDKSGVRLVDIKA